MRSPPESPCGTPSHSPARPKAVGHVTATRELAIHQGLCKQQFHNGSDVATANPHHRLDLASPTVGRRHLVKCTTYQRFQQTPLTAQTQCFDLPNICHPQRARAQLPETHSQFRPYAQWATDGSAIAHRTADTPTWPKARPPTSQTPVGGKRRPRRTHPGVIATPPPANSP